ncbi:hypothetical protein D3C74_431790 [compost metagenome]
MFASLEIMNFDKHLQIPAGDSHKFTDPDPVPAFFGQAANLQNLEPAKTLDGYHVPILESAGRVLLYFPVHPDAPGFDRDQYFAPAEPGNI